MKKVFSTVAGVFFILLGIVGLFLPFLQGFLFIFLGISFLSPKIASILRRKLARKISKPKVIRLDEWRDYGVRAGYTTRHFPLHIKKTGELMDEVNQEQFAKTLHANQAFALSKIPVERYVVLNQVHGDDFEVLTDAAAFEKTGFYYFKERDGALTNIPGLCLLSMSADCLSIFFRAKDWVGVIHAGWRGTQQKIAQEALQQIGRRAAVDPSAIQIIFGPCISGVSYEVGEEFTQYFPASSFKRINSKLYFNLAAENQRQLIEAGAMAKNIHNESICTVLENRDFHSFRKEGDQAGRIISYIVKV